MEVSGGLPPSDASTVSVKLKFVSRSSVPASSTSPVRSPILNGPMREYSWPDSPPLLPPFEPALAPVRSRDPEMAEPAIADAWSRIKFHSSCGLMNEASG